MRIALGIEYDGFGYHGWQRQQNNIPTIQGDLEAALSKIANEPISVQCAGRTDANVHALGQVVHFDTSAKRHIDAWIWGVNAHLPPSIVVRFAKAVDYKFHARFSAIARRYRYVVYNRPVRPAVLSHRVTWCYYPLDVERMRAAGQYLLGEQNFQSLRSSKCGSKTAMRNVTEFTVDRHGDFVIFEIQANAFLHHMVRNIIGVMLKIGSGLQDPHWLRDVLLAQDRRAAAETAPSDGLYFTKVFYPEKYSFPHFDKMFLL